jgi:preprotein translocase subunit SecG
MVGMVTVVIAVVVVAALVAVVVLRGRPKGTDLDSVRNYHSALGTLEHLAERNPPASMRVVNAPGQPDDLHVAPLTERGTAPEAGGPRRPSEVPPVPVRGNDEFPDPETPLVFDDARPRDRYRSGQAGGGGPAHRVDRAQVHALESMNHRPRRGLYTLAIVAVLVVFVVLAYTGSKRPASSKSAGRTTSSSTATGARHPGTGAHHAARHTSTTVHHASRPTPTTLPLTLVASTSTATSATYAVPFDRFQLTVTTSAPCWVQATTVSNGSVLWAGTIQPGVAQPIQAAGATSVQLGNPSATMVVGKIPVVLPTVLHTPFVATFQPSVPSAATTTTTTSAATSTPATSG